MSSLLSYIDGNLALPATMIVVLAVDICGPRKGEIRRALSYVSTWLPAPEAVGTLVVLGIIVTGLVFGSGGFLANHVDLEAVRLENPDVVEMRRIWPILCHPDSLLIVQQLFRILGFGLLLMRGGWDAVAGNFVPALLQLTAASGIRLYQWGLTSDYIPEGPLGGGFAVAVALVVFIVQLVASWKACRGSVGAPWRSTSYLPIQIAFQLAICMFTASTNHLVYAASMVSNVLFMGIEAADLVAAPVLAIAACIVAQEDHETAKGLLGTLHVLTFAQIMGFIWFLDFAGFFDDAASPDPFVRSLLQMKVHLQTNAAHGDPFTLMGVSQLIQLSSLLCSCLCVHMAIQDFVKKGVVGARVETIDALELVPYTAGVFGDDQDACCAICLSEFDVGDKLRKLPCDHKQFHAGCVDRWLAKAGRCPLCVGDITKSPECQVSHFRK